jgi:Zn-dependent protease with chaperone function
MEHVKTALLYGGGWPLALLLISAALVVPVACQWLGAAIALGSFRKSAPEGWAERARLIYPALCTLSFGPWILGLLSLVFVGSFASRLSFSGAHWLSETSMIGSFLIAAAVGARIESDLKQRAVTLMDWIRHDLILGVIFVPHIAVLFVVAVSMPKEFSADVWTYLLIAAAAILFYLFAGGLFVCRVLGLARAAPKRLVQITSVSAERLGVVARPNWVLRWKAANAVAFPMVNHMAFSDTALKYLADDELVAICIHEFGHLMESRSVKCLRVLAVLVWLPIIFVKPIAASYGFVGVVLTGLVVLFIYRAVRALTLAMEKRADALGHAHEGEPGTYARSLERLYQLNLVPAVTHHKNPTHPHLYDRLISAHVVPSYPRPNPPPRLRGRMSFLAMMLFGALLWFIIGGLVTFVLR